MTFESVWVSYASIIAGGLLVDHRGLGLQTYNRGVSGHKVPNLDARWQKDTIDLKPAVLSILIGVNDIWHTMRPRQPGIATLAIHSLNILQDDPGKPGIFIATS